LTRFGTATFGPQRSNETLFLGGPPMAIVQPILQLGPHDHGRSITAEEFAEADYAEPWRYERELGRLIVMPPDDAGHDDCSEPFRDHLGAYRIAHSDIVEKVVSEAWVRVDDGTDRIPDIAVFLRSPRSAVTRPGRVPELACEIVNPDRESRERVYVKKRHEYFRLGVLEYVVIDRMRHRATVYTSGARGYRKRVLRPGDVYTSPLLPGLAIPLVGIL
jgi:Uma2 family endonuclease